jgi:hypothetical protein
MLLLRLQVQPLLTKKKVVAKVLLLPFFGLLQHFFGVDFDTKPCSVSKDESYFLR